MVAVAAVSFCGLVIALYSITPRYAAETMLLLPADPTTQYAQHPLNPEMTQSDPLLIRSYLDIIKNDTLCRKVIRDLDLVHVPEFAPRTNVVSSITSLIQKAFAPTQVSPKTSTSAADEDRVLAMFEKRLVAKNDGKSLILTLTYQAEDPVLAAKIVNTQAGDYVASQTDYRIRQAADKGRWLKGELAAAAADVRAAQVELQMHMPTARAGAFSAAGDAADLKARQSIASAKEKVYESLLSKYMVLQAEEQYVTPDTRVIAMASVPTVPRWPNKPLLLIAATLVSLAFGASAAVAHAHFFRPLDLEKVAARIGAKSLGRIHMPGALDGVGLPNAVRLRRALFWEQIRELRGLLGAGQRGFVLSLVSFEQAAGSSLIAGSLARAIAFTGARTLVVDLNIRRPSVHTRLGVEPRASHGLGEVLQGSVQLTDALIPAASSSSLFLLTSAARGVRNVDCLAGKRLQQLIEELRDSFDFIILDTPPLGIVSDAFDAAALANGTLLLSSAKRLSIDMLGALVLRLRQRSVSLLGFAVTDCERSTTPSSADFRAYLRSDPLVDMRPVPARSPEAGASPMRIGTSVFAKFRQAWSGSLAYLGLGNA